MMVNDTQLTTTVNHPSKLWLIAKKDFLLNIISARFIIGLMLCVVVIPFTLLVNVDRYKNQMRMYQADEKRASDNSKEIRVYSQIRPEIIIKPEALSIFSNGVSNNMGNSVKVQLGEYPLFPSGHTATRDNPLLNAFFSIDFTSVIAILISLLALVFSYDLFTREREDGTLKVIFTNKVSRPAFLTGKLLGIIITLLPILSFCFLLAVLVVVLSPSVQFSASDWGGVALLFLSSMLYMIVFVLIGMFISTKTQRSSTSIVISMLCWIWFLFLMPNIASYLAQSFIKTEMYDNVQFALNDISAEYRKASDEKSEAVKRELNMNWINHWNYNSGDDGTEIMAGCDWNSNEYHRRLNIWREPERINYADKKWAVQKNYLDDLAYQEKVRAYLSWLSPSGIFEQIAETLCRTDPASFLQYMEHVRKYREQIIRYFTDKKLFASFAYFTPQPESTFPQPEDYKPVTKHFEATGKFAYPKEWDANYYPTLNLDEVPTFEYQGNTTSSALNASLGRICGMLTLCALILGATIISFIRYEIK